MKPRASAHPSPSTSAIGNPPSAIPAANRTALVAVLGASPAVLTETVWALAREQPPVIPDIVVTVTTTTGASTLDRQLRTPRQDWRNRTVWQALRSTVLGKGCARDPRLTLEAPVVIAAAEPATGTTRHLDDIRTAADNAAAAETILTAVRRFTTDPDCRVVGLLAGGRKTMGALLHAALSLAGRPGDRLLHVLVNEPFDHPQLTPPFWFPGQPGAKEHAAAEGAPVPQVAARIDLAEVPLVALGELISAQTGRTPATFASLTRAADAALAGAQAATVPLQVAFKSSPPTLRINSWRTLIPPGRASALCAWLCQSARGDDLLRDRVALAEHLRTRGVTFPKPDGQPGHFTDDDLSNALSVIRQSLQTTGVPAAIIARLLPLRAAIGFNREGVTVVSG